MQLDKTNTLLAIVILPSSHENIQKPPVFLQHFGCIRTGG